MFGAQLYPIAGGQATPAVLYPHAGSVLTWASGSGVMILVTQLGKIPRCHKVLNSDIILSQHIGSHCVDDFPWRPFATLQHRM